MRRTALAGILACSLGLAGCDATTGDFDFGKFLKGVEAAGAHVDKLEKERQEREAEYRRNNPNRTILYDQSVHSQCDPRDGYVCR